MPTNELLPCPFCGSEAKVEYRALAYEVGCLNKTCPGYIQADYDTRAVAVAAWNKRTALDRQPVQYVPVPNGTYHTDGPEILDVTDSGFDVYHGGRTERVLLQQGYALCRLSPAQEVGQPDERRIIVGLLIGEIQRLESLQAEWNWDARGKELERVKATLAWVEAWPAPGASGEGGA